MSTCVPVGAVIIIAASIISDLLACALAAALRRWSREHYRCRCHRSISAALSAVEPTQLLLTLRNMTRSGHRAGGPRYFDHLSDEEELWFDWMADCGDGWNSSYNIARLLAQPNLTVTIPPTSSAAAGDTVPSQATPSSTGPSKEIILPRAKLLLLGGDLAYPHPTPESYEARYCCDTS